MTPGRLARSSPVDERNRASRARTRTRVAEEYDGVTRYEAANASMVANTATSATSDHQRRSRRSPGANSMIFTSVLGEACPSARRSGREPDLLGHSQPKW